MSSDTFDRLRLPLALGLGLMLLVGYMFLGRTEADSPAPDASASVIVGEAGGGVVTPPPASTPSPSPSAEATPAVTPAPPAPTPSPIPTAEPSEEFAAEIMACRRISEAECIDEVNRLRANDETFVALMLFEGASTGDVLNAVLDGPSGPLDGGAYALEGSGRGYYYTTFAVSGLPAGEYTLTGLRNGEEVAEIELRKVGDDD